MITTGIIRRIEKRGIIGIPKKVREQVFGTSETENIAIEFFYEKDGTIVMKPVRN